MRKKRFLAVTLVASMVLGNAVATYGASFSHPRNEVTNSESASGNLTGNMVFEGTVSEDVFCVELPTTSYDADMFDFILDPQELIWQTKAIRYDKNSGITSGTPAADKMITSASQNFERSTLYFVNSISDGSNPVQASANRLSASSDALTIVNKSAIDVDVALTATVSGMDSVDMVSTNAGIGDKDLPSVYLALQGSASSNVAAVEETKAIMNGAPGSIQTQISGNDGAYIMSVNKTTGKYEKVLSENSEGFREYSFSLTGACGGGEIKDWQKREVSLNAAHPTVNVVWKVTPHVDVPDAAPSLPQSTYKVTANTAFDVNVDFGSGALAAKAIKKITNSAGTELGSNLWTANGNVITFTAAAANLIKSSMQFTIELDTGDKLSLTLTP